MANYAHEMIAKLSVEMANEVFEGMCSQSDKFWAAHKTDRQKRMFINDCAPTLVPEARKILAEMLGRNDVSAEDKEKIYDALMLDKCLPGANTFGKGVWELETPVQH